ncbi:MAG: hypothetical protein IKN39_03335 [Clostridia bacterium]|nr:hypothetical protein [Clostridia bacterium]
MFFGWILFKFTTVSDVFTAVKGMFGLNGNSFINFECGAVIKSNIFILLYCAVVSTPIVKRIGETVRFTLLNKRSAKAIYTAGRILIPLFLLIISTAALVGDSYNPFLYFQF